jgi:tetratricopeptide (TPR) repeat protein
VIAHEDFTNEIDILSVQNLAEAIARAFDMEKLERVLDEKFKPKVQLLRRQSVVKSIVKPSVSIVGIFSILLVFGLVFQQRISDFFHGFYSFPPDKIGIAITQFKILDIQSGRITCQPYLNREILRPEMQKVIDLSTVEIQQFSTCLDSPEAAQEWGKKKKAKVVVWGYVDTVENERAYSVRITLVDSPLTGAETLLAFSMGKRALPFVLSELLPASFLRGQRKRDISDIFFNIDLERFIYFQALDGLSYLDLDISHTTSGLIATVHLLKGNFLQAAKIYTSLLHKVKSPNTYIFLALASIHARQALVYRSQKEWHLARDVLERLLHSTPSDPRLWLFAGYLYTLMGDIPSAIEVFKRVADYEPYNPLTYLFLANTYPELGEWDKARVALEKAVSLAPQEPLIHYLLGSFYSGTFHHDPFLHFMLPLSYHAVPFVNIYADSRHFNQAPMVFQKALSLDKGFAEAHFSLLLHGLRKKLVYEGFSSSDLVHDVALAREKLEQKHTSDFQSLYAILYAGRLQELHSPFEAEDIFKKLLEKFPLPSIYLTVGGFWERHGFLEHARYFYASGLRDFPHSSILLNALANVLFTLDDLTTAENVYKQLLDITPFSFMPKYKLGLVYHKQKRYREAEELFRNLANDPLIKPFSVLRIPTLLSFSDAAFALGNADAGCAAYDDIKSQLSTYNPYSVISNDQATYTINYGDLLYLENVSEYKPDKEWQTDTFCYLHVCITLYVSNHSLKNDSLYFWDRLPQLRRDSDWRLALLVSHLANELCK